MCFIWMLRIVAMVFDCFRIIFLSVLTVFRRMLQLLYLDVSKVDQVLYLSSPLSAVSSLSTPQGIRMTPRPSPFESKTPHALSLSLLGRRGPRVERETSASHGLRALALPLVFLLPQV
jgi:hypothetical protein